jgi:hypothetical protein
MRLSTVATSVTGAAVLAVTALAVPASASPAPHNIDGGQYAGYQASVPGVTSVSADWTEPTTSCAGLTEQTPERYLWTEVSLSQTGEWGEASAGVEIDCWINDNGVATITDYAATGIGLGPDGYFSDPVVGGDAMSASVARVGANYVMTIADATQNWTETQTEPIYSEQDDTANVWMRQPGNSTEYGFVGFRNAMVNGQPLAAVNPTALDSTERDGTVDHTGPLSGGAFTITRS